MSMLERISEFLACKTPLSWLEMASSRLDLLLIDHAHCEKKAASTALSLMYRYVDYPKLLQSLSRLAREELRHFEQVLKLLQQRNIAYIHLEPCAYAKRLRENCHTYEPKRLIDLLIISAIIEARSCERFAALIKYLPNDLAEFYATLVQAEARHFEIYLNLIKLITQEPVEDRIQYFIQLENQLILQPEANFRFHSGIPS